MLLLFDMIRGAIKERGGPSSEGANKAMNDHSVDQKGADDGEIVCTQSAFQGGFPALHCQQPQNIAKDMAFTKAS